MFFNLKRKHEKLAFKNTIYIYESEFCPRICNLYPKLQFTAKKGECLKCTVLVSQRIVIDVTYFDHAKLSKPSFLKMQHPLLVAMASTFSNNAYVAPKIYDNRFLIPICISDIKKRVFDAMDNDALYFPEN